MDWIIYGSLVVFMLIPTLLPMLILILIAIKVHHIQSTLDLFCENVLDYLDQTEKKHEDSLQ